MKIAKTAGAVVTSLGLVVGMSAFAGATQATIDTSGNHNGTTVTDTNTSTSTLSNQNNVGALNLNGQLGASGAAEVHGGSSSGSATTGAVSNSNVTSTTITVKN